MLKITNHLSLLLCSVSLSTLAFAQSPMRPVFPMDLPQRLACPEPAQIQVTPVPHSFNAIYTAEVHGVGFMGYDINGLQPSEMAFKGAAVSEVNGYWSLTCSYASSQGHLIVATQDTGSLTQCAFENSAQRCEGLIRDCVLVCH